MKQPILLLLLLIILLLSISSWSQEDHDEYYDIEEIKLEETLKPINWCIEETMPVWIGCDNDSIGDLNKCTEQNILHFIQTNLIIPSDLGCFQGKVFISFVIDKDGDVVDIELLKGVHELLDAAAVEVIKKLPKFQPATQRNRPFEVKVNVPVNFRVH